MAHKFLLISTFITTILLVIMECPSSVQGQNPKVYKSAAELFEDLDFGTPAARTLLEREKQHKTPYIQKVNDRVFVAVDYALGYSIWIVSPQNTIIIIDTPEGYPPGVRMREDMRARPEIGNKTISAIIYTIFHADHTYGARAFVEDPANNGKIPRIISHKNTIPEAYHYDTFNFFKLPRAVHMFGLALPPSAIIDPFSKLQLGNPLRIEYYPNESVNLTKFGDRERRTIDGLVLEFIYTPGYTADQLTVWLPNDRIVMPADNYYDAYPNLYTIRGEPARDVMQWAESSRLVLELDPQCMAPSHTVAICGKEIIRDIIEKYSDAIQFTHDQTIRFMAKGYTADIISDYISLPPTFTTQPYLAQVYGTPITSVRAIVDRLVGWFSGQAEDLLPANRYSRANDMVKYFSANELMKVAERAYKNRDYKFALDMSTYVWLNSRKRNTDALYYRTNSVKRLAENMVNAPIRNYLLTTALKDWDLVENPLAKALIKINSRQSLLTLHIDGVFKLMQYHANSAMLMNVDRYLLLNLLDDKRYVLHIRNFVLLVTEDKGSVTNKLSVETTSMTWKRLVAGAVTVRQALLPQSGQQPLLMISNGSVQDLEYFLSLFDFDDEI